MSFYIVAGMGKSGIAAAKLLIAGDDSVILFDENRNADVQKAIEAVFGDELFADGAEDEAAEEEYFEDAYDDDAFASFFESDDDVILEFALGELEPEQIRKAEACVISPGIPLNKPWVADLEEAGVPIWSEIELAWRSGAGKLAAITGTNGKTTTTALTGELFAAAFPESYTLGNIGIPYTEKAREMTEEAVTALEVSSFQLETIDEFRPDVSAILNLTPDHLDRHGDMEGYFAVKKRIAENQGPKDVCVLNYEDAYCRGFGEELQAREDAPRVFWFSNARELEEGIWFADDVMYARRGGLTVELVRADELKIIGDHNRENALAAAGIALNMGVPVPVICEVLRNFRAVEHRLEYVCEKNGVVYYNDSKGTNPDSTIKAMNAMTRPTLLIAGGYDKKSDFHEVLGIAKPKLKELILLGATADQIEREAREVGIENIVRVQSLEEAVRRGAADAEAGDCVLLSPACASWDMFPNFEVRGKEFKAFCEEL
ncbi:MAG: UDP-N-acetylmuramoyl-L-alanine--D-glutamate ligase [Lachnospiraceae bacterium]|nr:UDP-N-acetylmuramoyl-L-alanine--D-glutamate ligase [Lachnospiraceae bacterium]